MLRLPVADDLRLWKEPCAYLTARWLSAGSYYSDIRLGFQPDDLPWERRRATSPDQQVGVIANLRLANSV